MGKPTLFDRRNESLQLLEPIHDEAYFIPFDSTLLYDFIPTHHDEPRICAIDFELAPIESASNCRCKCISVVNPDWDIKNRIRIKRHVHAEYCIVQILIINRPPIARPDR